MQVSPVLSLLCEISQEKTGQPGGSLHNNNEIEGKL